MAPPRPAPPTGAEPGPRRPTKSAAPDPAGRIGDYAIVTSLLRDSAGEVLLARGPEGLVRLRVIDSVMDSSVLAGVQLRLGRIEHPGLAPTTDRRPAGRDGVALVGPPDRWSLADRGRRPRLGVPATVALGATLLEALAALHAAGVAHGGIEAGAVGIDDEGRPRWRDVALWAARRRPAQAGPAPAEDVRGFADLMRGAGALPPRLATAVEAVASGAVETPSSAGLLALWRDCAREAGVGVPPPGATVRVAALLPASRRVRRPLPRRLRLAAAVVAAACAVAVIPVARLLPGGAPALLDVSAYLPDHTGETLTYAYSQDTGAGSPTTSVVQLRVGSTGTVAGIRTVEVVPVSPAPVPATGGPAAAPPPLPLGLGGATLRLENNAISRAATGGAIRDLVGPLRPGLRWSDARAGEAGFTTTETRVTVGPASLTEPAGHFEHCVVTALAAVVTSPSAGRTTQAAGYAWYCQGIGLTRALLIGQGGEQDVIDLNSVG